MKKISYILLIIFVGIISAIIFEKSKSDSIESLSTESNYSENRKNLKKVLYINSYHEGYDWSDGIHDAMLKTFKIHKGSSGKVTSNNALVNLKVIEMDTKRNSDIHSKEQAALEAKKIIETWKPDLIIGSDDNVSKYVIAKYFKESKIPFIFCGVNWSAREYEFNSNNVTGMIEVQLVDKILELLAQHAKGGRISFLKGDDESTRKEAKYFEETFDITLDKRFVKNYQEWEKEYIKLQDVSDIILLGNTVSVQGWNYNKASLLVSCNTKVPTATWSNSMKKLSLITLATKPSEQGEWVAKRALEILNGKNIKDIDIVKNKKASFFINMQLVKVLHIKFPYEILNSAQLINNNPLKVLYVNSYHNGYQWSDELEKGLLKAFNHHLCTDEKSEGIIKTCGSEYELKIFRMNTKLNRDDTYIQSQSMKIKSYIDSWRPDVVIVSDDNAAQHVLSQYYLESEIPFVFCGVNNPAKTYGFPTKNITGMIEIDPVVETIELLRRFSKGERIGYLGVNSISEINTINTIKGVLGVKFDQGKFVETFDEWKKQYLLMQDSVDMIYLVNPVGIKDWNMKQASEFVLQNSKIPSGTCIEKLVDISMIGRVKIGEEQGWWSGKTAIKILEGASPTDIPIVSNKTSKLLINMNIANKLNIKIPINLIQQATIIE